MKKSLLVPVMLLFSVFVFGQKASDNFTGKWKTEEGVHIEISKNQKSFTGKIVKNNKMVVENLHFTDGKWSATMISPKDGTKVNATLTLEGNKINIAVKKGIISKTIIWTKL